MYAALHGKHPTTALFYKDGEITKAMLPDGTAQEYGYDKFRNLGFVLSPEYQKSGYKDKYAYEYRYDKRGNVVKKIMPGCEYTQYWYDAADRMAFMQDATLRERGLYRFFLYDIFGRLAIQGTCKECTRTAYLNTARFSADGGLWGTGYNIPYAQYIGEPILEIVNYYDNHDFISLYSNELGCAATDFQGSDMCSMTKPTGSLYISSSGERILSATFYNPRGIASDEVTLLSGKRLTTTHTEYSYTGAPLRTTVMEHSIHDGKKALAVSMTTENTYSDKTDNLLRTDVTINGKRATTKAITYDDLGRIKSIANGMGLEPVNYEYDLHGWTKSISSKAFSESLHYADGPGEPCYNGNISSILWQTANDTQKRGYKFTYDKLGRISEAVYGEGESLADKKNRYNEKVPSSGIIPPMPIYVSTTEYSQSIQYKDGKPDKVLFDGGYCTFNVEDGTPVFHYFIKDHLGNNRAVIREDGTIEQISSQEICNTLSNAGLHPKLQQIKIKTNATQPICQAQKESSPKSNCYVVTKIKKKENNTWFIYVTRNDSNYIIASEYDPRKPKEKMIKVKKGFTFEGELVYWDIHMQQMFHITPLREHYFDGATFTKPLCDMAVLQLQYCKKFNGKYYIKEQ